MPEDSDREQRESLLSILRQHRACYFWTFVALTLAWLTFAGWWQVAQGCLRIHWALCVDRVMPSASGAMPFILSLTIALADAEIWLARRFKLVFLKLPPTREERLRREVRAETLREAEKQHAEALRELRQEAEKQRAEAINEVRQEEEKRRAEALRDARQAEEIQRAEDTAEEKARYAAWYARMKEAQDKDEPFDEPPPWEQ